MTNFSKQLTRYRKAAAISQEKLADMLGVSRQAVSKWETAESQPEMANVRALCEILKVSPNQLMGWYPDGDRIQNQAKEAKTESDRESDREKDAVILSQKMSKLVIATAVICICVALAAGIFIGKEIEASKAPVSLLEGRTNMEITGFIYDFDVSLPDADLKMTVMPGIADEKLKYQIVAIGGPEGEKIWTAEYKDGLCTAYIKTVPYYEIVYVLRVSDGKKFINKSLFKVYDNGDYTWTHQELWQRHNDKGPI